MSILLVIMNYKDIFNMKDCIDFTLFCDNFYKNYRINEFFNHYDNRNNSISELCKLSSRILISFTADNSLTAIRDLQDNEILLSLYKDKPNNVNIDKFIHDLSITCFYKHYLVIRINLTFSQRQDGNPNLIAVCSSEQEIIPSFKKRLKTVLNNSIAYNSETVENAYFE